MIEPVTIDQPAARAVIEQEAALYQRVRKHLTAALLANTRRLDLDADLISLRDQIAEARAEDVAPLIEQMYRTAAVAARREQGRAAPPPDPLSPYFGHLVLREGDRQREVLIGKRSHIDTTAGVVIVDWRQAPVSRLFYRYHEGDTYVEELGGRVVEGEIVARRTLTILGGKLRRISDPSGTYFRRSDGQWTVATGDGNALAGGQRTALRPSRAPRSERLGVGDDAVLRPDKHLHEIAALIDPEQFRLITQQTDRIAVLRGGAGSGKTTVALHRMAYLHFQDPHRFRTSRMLVVVPQPGLAEYVNRVLPSLEVDRIERRTMVEWARRIRRRALPRLRFKSIDEVPDSVALVKSHPALLGVLDAYVADQTARIGDQLEQALARQGVARDIVDAFWAGAATPLHTRLGQARAAAKRAAARPRDAVTKILALAQRRIDDVLTDWAEILTDRERLSRALAPTLGPQTERCVSATLRQVVAQLDDPDELSDLADDDRRAGLDGRIDDDGLSRRLDPCDEALILRLWQIKRGGLTTEGGRPIVYDHIAVDEAQDFSAIELKLLLDAVRDSAMTLAGDMAQKIVFTNSFETWDELLRLLGAEARVETLGLSYRSTREVMALARAVLGPIAPAGEAACTRSGAPIELFCFSDIGAAVAFLADSLRSLMGRERAANVAVLCRFSLQADLVFQGLQRAEVPFVRRVTGGDYSFRPGIDVADVASAKGLEFDYVLLVDADAVTYPDTIECRHLLHVAITRTVHQLWLTCAGTPSPLLPRELVADAL
ncbi:MAG: ATP-binding domain-containing protein [Deltaproteobacteria bacterium]|nr:ATP-binding domain-containing protein [Deltaproteobacteria bacterium]